MKVRDVERRYVITFIEPLRKDVLNEKALWYESPEDVVRAIRRARRRVRLVSWVTEQCEIVLTDLERGALLDHYLDGRTLRAIARDRGVYPSTVARNIERAIAKIRIAAYATPSVLALLSRLERLRLARRIALNECERPCRRDQVTRQLLHAQDHFVGRRKRIRKVALNRVHKSRNHEDAEIEHQAVRKPHDAHVAVAPARGAQKSDDLLRPRGPGQLK